MSAVRSILLILCLAAGANAQTRTLAVNAGVPPGMDAASTRNIQSELQKLLRPADIEVTWQGTGDSTSEREFELLVVGSYSGSCAVNTLPPDTSRNILSRSLGNSIVVRDRVLPYFQVDCGLLIKTLSPILGPLSIPMRREILERAMARVIAHEIYHIVAHTTEHDKSGVAKASFSLEDLVARNIEFNGTSLDRMRLESAGHPSDAALRPEPPLRPVRASAAAASGSRSVSASMLLPR